jgi:hypothetical protein
MHTHKQPAAHTDLYARIVVYTVNKQVNDKERVAAALENPSLRPIVDACIGGPGDY